MLFVDLNSKDLFKFDFSKLPEADGVPPSKGSIVIFPTNMGCTGYALEKNRVIYFNKGETMS